MSKISKILKFFIIIFAVEKIACAEEDKQDKYIRKVVQKRKANKIVNNSSKRYIFLKEQQKQELNEQQKLQRWIQYENFLKKKEYEDMIKSTEKDREIDNLNLKDAKKKEHSSFYIQAGVGTTGFYANAGLYYLNFVGIRGEYSYFPKWSPGFVTDLLQKAEPRIYNNTLDIQHTYGVDFSIRPFALFSKALSGFRIDIGVRHLNAVYNIYVKQQVNVDLNSSISSFANDHGLSPEGLKIIVNNMLRAHNLDILLNGEGKLTIPIEMAKGFKPYFGIGWDINIVSGLDLSFSLGVIVSQWKYGEVSITYKDKNIESYKNIINSYTNELYRISQEGVKDHPLIKENDVRYIHNFLYGTLDNLIDNFKTQATKMEIINKIPVYPVIQIGLGWQFDLF